MQIFTNPVGQITIIPISVMWCLVFSKVYEKFKIPSFHSDSVIKIPMSADGKSESFSVQIKSSVAEKCGTL
jgi:hypothetical protein